ncbi:MAG: ABC transporter substrate-binding protein, partial [Synergistaceae bacterium]|nr:ABC transporter substrate-binding protein [Synergistaceae bacterium]
MALKRKQKLAAAGAVLVAAVLAIVFTALGSKKTNPDAVVSDNGKELTVIRTFTRTDCGITPYLVADQIGFFAEEGLKIVYTGTVDYNQQLATILNGDNDIGDAHPNELAMFIKGGAAVKGVSRDDIEPLDEKDVDYRHMKYFVKADSPIKTWSDLVEYRVGSEILINGTIPSCSTFVPSTIFDKFGIGRERIKFVT